MIRRRLQQVQGSRPVVDDTTPVAALLAPVKPPIRFSSLAMQVTLWTGFFFSFPHKTRGSNIFKRYLTGGLSCCATLLYDNINDIERMILRP
jgi:hypothetical protein